MRVTLKDIADEAGVSLMTVSNVVNGNRARVSQRTIDRVQAIVDARGYVPSASARSLAANTSRLIGLLVPAADDESLLVSPHYIAVSGLLERQLRKHGYHLLLRGVSRSAEVIEAVQSWNLDGAVLLGFNDEDVDLFTVRGRAPMLALDSYAANPLTTGVRSDDLAGGRMAASYLLQRGHRKIVFAGPPFAKSGVVHQRLAGLRVAHREAGIPWSNARVAPVGADYQAGVEFGQRLRRDHPGVTAVFATADILAIGIMEGLRIAGLSVPEDVSVIGFDNVDISGYVTPKLTTISQDIVVKTEVIARMLLAEIEQRELPIQPQVIGVELVERDSVADVPVAARTRR
ncbi:MAG: LacI family DNA-binding transcriptional regulator [Nakamurella sp.]